MWSWSEFLKAMFWGLFVGVPLIIVLPVWGIVPLLVLTHIVFKEE